MKQLELHNNIQLLFDEYLVFFDDEITIKFESSNKMENTILYYNL
ncbi:hypothetical protein [Marinicellulosiphila megalodicopiae]